MSSSRDITTDIQMRDRSLVKQIKCPKMARTTYNTSITGDFDDSSLKFVFNSMIPEVSGYMLGYNFSGVGSNDSRNASARGGFKSVGDDENRLFRDRVLGYNYFLPMEGTCGPISHKRCRGKKQYQYVRNYPVFMKGNAGAMVEDALDLIPDRAIRALFTPSGTTKCQPITLPVGSALDSDKKFKNKKDFVTKHNTCVKNCAKKDHYQIPNCRKSCLRGWWNETRCMEKPSATMAVEYPHPTLHADDRDPEHKATNSSREYDVPSMFGYLKTLVGKARASDDGEVEAYGPHTTTTRTSPPSVPAPSASASPHHLTALIVGGSVLGAVLAMKLPVSSIVS